MDKKKNFNKIKNGQTMRINKDQRSKPKWTKKILSFICSQMNMK